MPSDKDRLYVVLHTRGGAPKMPGKEDTYVFLNHYPNNVVTGVSSANRYHWSLVVGPKTETPEARGMRYHAKEMPTCKENLRVRM